MFGQPQQQPSAQLSQPFRDQQALQQLLATQSIFNSLTPDQRLVAQRLAAETIQLNFMQQELPKNLQVRMLDDLRIKK